MHAIPPLALTEQDYDCELAARNACAYAPSKRHALLTLRSAFACLCGQSRAPTTRLHQTFNNFNFLYPILQDYNRELAARDAGDMEQWLTALQNAMDAADTGEGLPTSMDAPAAANSTYTSTATSNSTATTPAATPLSGGGSVPRRESVEGGVGGKGDRVVSIAALSAALPMGFTLDQVKQLPANCIGECVKF